MAKNYWLYSLVIYLFFACQNRVVTKEEMDFSPESEEILISNSFLASEEKFRITRFVTRSPLSFAQTGTGLFYHISRKGIGRTIRVGDIVFLDFKVRGLDGTFYYQNPFELPLEFMVGKYDLASGLHQGMEHLQMGSKATFLLPSHLAHGLLGDREKIPPRMPIIWEIHVLRVLFR